MNNPITEPTLKDKVLCSATFFEQMQHLGIANLDSNSFPVTIEIPPKIWDELNS